MQISFTIDAQAFEQEQKEPVKKTLKGSAGQFEMH